MRNRLNLFKTTILLSLLFATVNVFATDGDMELKFDTNKSAGTTITLPLQGTVNVTVDWGDSSTETVTSAGNLDHTYDSEGVKTVTISGELTQFGRYNYPNADKLVAVSDFGNLGITSLARAFYNAINLTSVPPALPETVTEMYCMFEGATSFNDDISDWDVSSVTDMESMFKKATSFTGDINDWDVSSVTDMGAMFSGATSFTGGISAWNVSSVTNMEYMFRGVRLPTANYNAMLKSWSELTLQPNVVFDAGNSKYTDQASRDILTNAPNSWTITDAGAIITGEGNMLLEFDTNKSAETTITLPLQGTVNVTVNWGDGNTETVTSAGNLEHTYTSEGIKIVIINGELTQFGKYDYQNVDKLVSVLDFGNCRNY